MKEKLAQYVVMPTLLAMILIGSSTAGNLLADIIEHKAWKSAVKKTLDESMKKQTA